MNEFITFNFPNISYQNLQILSNISKVLGNYKFLQNYNYLRKIYQEENIDILNIDFPKTIIKHMFNSMTEQEKIKFKSLNILNQANFKLDNSLLASPNGTASSSPANSPNYEKKKFDVKGCHKTFGLCCISKKIIKVKYEKS